MREMQQDNINWISIQNLIGGLAIGAEAAFETPPVAIIHQGWINDSFYINYMNKTRLLNIPVIRMNSDFETFYTNEDEKIYNSIILNNKIDVSVCCPICSGLSQMNASNTGSKARGDANNDQNQNMYNITKLAMRLNSRVIAFENAPGLYTKAGIGVVKMLKDLTSNEKYGMNLFYTDTLKHGIPQSRKRTFATFFKNSNPPIFKYSNVETPELADYLNELNPDIKHMNEFIEEKYSAIDDYYKFIMYETKSSSFLEAINKIDPANKKSTWTSAQIVIEIGLDKAIDYFSDDKIKAKLIHIKTKLSKGLSFWDNTTILANRGKFTNAIVGKSLTSMIHPTEERAYNIRELLHLMGMPNDFVIADSKKNYNCICQNVPVKTSTFIANNIKDYLNSELELYSSDFIKQHNIKQKIDE